MKSKLIGHFCYLVIPENFQIKALKNLTKQTHKCQNLDSMYFLLLFLLSVPYYFDHETYSSTFDFLAHLIIVLLLPMLIYTSLRAKKVN